MDFRLLVVGLLLNASAPLFFSLLWGLVWSLAVGKNLTSLLDISIVGMIAVLSFGLFLVGYGLVRGGVVKDWQAGILFLGSLALGVLTFTFYVSMGMGYGDDLAACGGIPPRDYLESTGCDSHPLRYLLSCPMVPDFAMGLDNASCCHWSSISRLIHRRP